MIHNLKIITYFWKRVLFVCSPVSFNGSHVYATWQRLTNPVQDFSDVFLGTVTLTAIEYATKTTIKYDLK